jgi:O-antigen ligase
MRSRSVDSVWCFKRRGSIGAEKFTKGLPHKVASTHLISVKGELAQLTRDCHSAGSKRKTRWAVVDDLRARLHACERDALLFGLAVCAVPVSIAVAELLLAGALFFRIIALARRREQAWLPPVFWFWLVWAALEIVAWLRSPDLRAGRGEMRHLLLIAALFLLVPTITRARDRVLVWSGIALTATANSIYLIGHFVFRLLFYRGNLDPVVYLRGGGLLHHWMVYTTVEVMVFAGLLQLWHFFPEKRWWLRAVLIINTVAMILSLTRTLWICALLVLALHLAWIRSRWFWALPALPCILWIVAPGVVRSRVTDTANLEYYSNAERLQMLRVGWKMVREKPLTGVGPGRVDGLYVRYLSPADPVPAYHGHLHNNVAQLAAEFGLPVLAAAAAFLVILVGALRRQCATALNRDQEFLCRTALLGLFGFLAAGMFDYTYGHSLGLNLLGFVVLSPLVPTLKRAILFRRRSQQTCLHSLS